MENLKEIVANVIVESLEHDFLEKKYSLNLDSHNCLRMMKSDVINTHLKKVFNSDRYIVHKFNRFAWEGRFIIDLESKSLVSITSISNLNHIPKVKERRIPHYMQTLLKSLNESVITNQQMSFEVYSEFETEVYEDDMSQIFNGLDIDMDNYIYYVVAYDYSSNKVTEMNWYLLGAEFNIAEKSSMMDLVKPDFINLTVAENLKDTSVNSQELKESPKKGIKLGLKENIQKKEG